MTNAAGCWLSTAVEIDGGVFYAIDAAGRITESAAAMASTPDPNLANNTATVRLTVL